ncbi:MAG: hypothetical protein J5676_13755 [Bacteroidaceae bacterium]|nr:hypothetical protein [Bacteroidaceae bacterium]
MSFLKKYRQPAQINRMAFLVGLMLYPRKKRRQRKPISASLLIRAIHFFDIESAEIEQESESSGKLDSNPSGTGCLLPNLSLRGIWEKAKTKITNTQRQKNKTKIRTDIKHFSQNLLKSKTIQIKRNEKNVRMHKISHP